MTNLFLGKSSEASTSEKAGRELVSLRPNVSRAEAELELSGSWSRLRFGPLRTIAECFVPFRIFRITIDDGRRQGERILALDAASATFDAYGFPDVPPDETLQLVRSDNVAPARIDEDRLREIVTERTRRMVFSSGFFRVRSLAIEAVPLREIHVPYWLGFSGRGEEAHLRALDAVRRRIEGPKVTEFFREWLGEQS